MKKKIFFRALIGIPIGVTISTFILIIISIAVGDGRFYAYHPDLVKTFGNEVYAVIIQTVFSMIYGAAWGGASVIWDIEKWSLTRMTVTHLVICSVFTFPIAYFMCWMPHNIVGVLSYFGIFFLIYFIIWGVQYFMIKRRIYNLNQKIKK